MLHSFDTLSSQTLKVSCVAHTLNSVERQDIGVKAIGGNTPITHIANHHNVSRKFVYQQKEKVLDGIEQAFNESSSKDSEKVLFYIPVTKKNGSCKYCWLLFLFVEHPIKE